MKKLLSFVLCLALLLAACGNNNEASSSKSDSKERTFTTEGGEKVKIPKNPKRILLLTANYGNLKKLGVEPVAITSVFPDSKYLDMKDVKKIDPEDVEAAAKLKPDLIVTYKENKNNNKLSKIAPTVSLKVQDTDYKQTHIEYGKLVNKEEKAKKQADELSDKLLKDGKEIKKHIGADKTASIMDVQAKDIYQFGARFGRGSDALFDGFKLKEDPEAKKAMPKEKFMKVPQEKFNDYSGDYLFIPTKDGKKPNNEFTNSTIWKNNKAVKNNNVIYYTSNEALYGDLISVEKQAETFKKELLKK
ncbi:ABC transporter substrate-binding protein [Mammaliicoccus sciuri]|uniref:ABC transporter substrate-binding protein n=1 Tax=Mammaliicoccus TaxID=2803850 RepID=UPI00197EB445|nr:MULTISPECIES: ABC transporter substrate-binding protein [Mammaliicoccus]MCD3219961.1 ABC transporter substrate-binding protein [Mammaliicoccus sciuri]MCD8807700.1 ABC transporter substrate-binding protein [Mammaliicoccus sciuri]MCJ0908466.1 ABC transporter substrate-binding protein [Mammaliicoccus sciuri]MCJ0919281.1 ABC transporter substrate-binding protein [Mammaliicoccus sciuri]MCJ0956947.1 ABC transporter substrate-binding protein [Mammaliicoccus sciuri]